MSSWLTRLRVVLADHFPLAVVACVALVLVGGWFTYGAYGATDDRTEIREEPTWTSEARFDHAATVTEPNEVYDEGTTLRNRSVYFANVAPELDGQFTYGYAAPGGGNLTVRMETTLVLRSVDRGPDGELRTVYWRSERPLETTTVAGLSPGERANVSFAVNVTRLANRSERITEDLGETPGETEALVRVDVAQNGTVGGDAVDRTDEYALHLGVGDVYRVDDPGVVREKHTTTRTVTVADTGGLLRRLAGPLLLVASLGALGAVLTTRARGRLAPPAEARERLAFEDARSEYDEWINTISLPPNAHDLPRAEAASLDDLVDFAIDTDNGVVEDPSAGTYYVIHDGILYVYEPPTAPTEGDPLRSAGSGPGERRAGTRRGDDEEQGDDEERGEDADGPDDTGSSTAGAERDGEA